MKNRTELMAELIEKADWLIMSPKTDHYGNYSSEYKTAFDEYCRIRAELAEAKDRSAEDLIRDEIPAIGSNEVEDSDIVYITVERLKVLMHQFATQQVTAATEEIKRERDEYYDTLQEYRLKTADMEKRIQELEAQVPKWISVEERLPERSELTDDKLVLVDSVLYGGIMVCKFKNCKFIDPIDDTNVTEYVERWMPLPQPIN